MVIELFAIDSKIYSTSILPFSMMWFLAKSAICQFKIYSMTFSSCTYDHSGGCGLKAWNKKKKVITSSPSSCSLIFLSISTYNMNHSGTVGATKENQSRALLMALATMMLVTWDSIFISSHHHPFQDIVQTKQAFLFPEVIPCIPRAWHDLCEVCIAHWVLCGGLCKVDYMMNLLGGYRIQTAMAGIGRPSKNLINTTHLTDRK